jgi:hypothetical protein
MNRRDLLSVSTVPFLASCIGGGSGAIAQARVLTQEVKAQLETAADSVPLFPRLRT